MHYGPHVRMDRLCECGPRAHTLHQVSAGSDDKSIGRVRLIRRNVEVACMSGNTSAVIVLPHFRICQLFRLTGGN